MEKMDTPGPPGARPEPSPDRQALMARGMELLELPQVLERLAGHTTFPLGREAALGLRPSRDPDEVAHRQRETAEARRFLEGGGALDLAAAGDVRAAVERAVKGGALSGMEVRQVGEALATARVARGAVLRRRADAPALAAVAQAIPDLRELEERATRSVTPAGEVDDRASPRLREVRQEARAAYSHLEEALQRIVRSPMGREVLQEPLVTERSGRLVVPVRVEARRRLPGLVHDVSDSGATVFVEPMATVTLGNRWRELQIAEAREVERVLRELSSSIGGQAVQVTAVLELLARLDLAMARGRYAIALRGVTAATPSGGQPVLRLVEARHPLLRGGVVPISLALGGAGAGDRDGGATVLVITGPNAGGKTVSLKTTGLLALMHQAGLQTPAAEGTVLPSFDGVYADIGDQQSIERSLSTFTSHMTTIRAILEAATPASLVLLDEVGSSTDPEEGAALAKALLEQLLRAGVPTVATTHQRDVAAFAQETTGMANASVELDPVTLAPTYRLTMGLPGRSYALAIASRLGLPSRLLERARWLLAPLHRSLEELLARAQQDRRAASLARAEAEEARARADALRMEAEDVRERLRLREQEALQSLRRDLQERADLLLARLQAAEAALLAAPPAAGQERAAALRQAAAEVKEVRRVVRSRALHPTPSDRPAWLHRLSPGDRVAVRGFPVSATLISRPDAQGMAEVAVGALRARIPVEHLSRPADGGLAPGDGGPAPRPQPTAHMALSPHTPSRELDIRGMKVEEALTRLEAFLDHALLDGGPTVRVVHGAGTGALRDAVRRRLTGHPAVKAWLPEEGRYMDGATVVELA